MGVRAAPLFRGCSPAMRVCCGWNGKLKKRAQEFSARIWVLGIFFMVFDEEMFLPRFDAATELKRFISGHNFIILAFTGTDGHKILMIIRADWWWELIPLARDAVFCAHKTDCFLKIPHYIYWEVFSKIEFIIFYQTVWENSWVFWEFSRRIYRNSLPKENSNFSYFLRFPEGVKRDLVIKGFDRKNVKYEEGLRVWETPLETGAEKGCCVEWEIFQYTQVTKKRFRCFSSLKV